MSDNDPLEGLLAGSHFAGAHQLPSMVREHAAALGCTDALIYLSDLQQNVLVPFLAPGGPQPQQQLESLPIDSTLVGRSFQQVEILTRPAAQGEQQMIVPLLDGTERLGVLVLTMPAEVQDPNAGRLGVRIRRFSALVAEMIMSKTQYGDTIVRLRRTGEMGLAAELQWSLLPPLTFACRDATVSAALEPAYQVAGDTVDYAVDFGIVRAGVFDGMGHGLTSAQLATLAVAAYRNARRNGLGLVNTAEFVHDSVNTSFRGTAFTTAVLVELDTQTGLLRWLNAGQPEPLLLRQGRLVRALQTAPMLPLGLRVSGMPDRQPSVGAEHLQPGDLVLMFTDGVPEARSPDGEFFGERRLVDLVVRNLAAGLPAPETMRRVVRALLDHQQGQLTDDATLLLLEWRSDNMHALVPADDLLPD